jgi:hypothetical protein
VILFKWSLCRVSLVISACSLGRKNSDGLAIIACGGVGAFTGGLTRTEIPRK